MTIRGIGFTSSSKVKPDGTTAPSVTPVSATQLRATVPAATGPITVTNTATPEGTVRSKASYTVC